MDKLLQHMPLDTDFILLERKEYSAPLVQVGDTIAKSLTIRGRKVVFTGTYGYVITNQGAKKLLASTDQGCFPIDVIIPMSYFDNKINHCIARIEVATHNRNFQSVIIFMGMLAWNEVHLREFVRPFIKPNRKKILERLLLRNWAMHGG